MFGKIKYKLLKWLINDMCKHCEKCFSYTDECYACYGSVVDIQERAAGAWKTTR